ncbi:hypothetical protein D3C77_759410 [compost metagenome]
MADSARPTIAISHMLPAPSGEPGKSTLRMPSSPPRPGPKPNHQPPTRPTPASATTCNSSGTTATLYARSRYELMHCMKSNR